MSTMSLMETVFTSQLMKEYLSSSLNATLSIILHRLIKFVNFRKDRNF